MIVVDASIAVSWLLSEAQSLAARALLRSSHELIAVDLVKVEVLSALLKSVRTRRLPPSEAALAIQSFDRVQMRLVPASDHALDAYAIAQRHGGSIYDACYIALARSLAAPLATDDEAMAKVAEAVGVAAHRASQGFSALLD